MMPEMTHQTAALIEKVEAAGLSALAGSSVAIPIPAPSIVSRTWTTSATTTPAKIAPHATRLIMMVWASSSMVGRVRVAVVCTSDGSCTGAAVSVYWVNGVNLCWDAPGWAIVAVEAGRAAPSVWYGWRASGCRKPACSVTRLHQRFSTDRGSRS